MAKPFLRAFGVEPHFAAFAVHRHDPGDAEFGRLLQDQVHLFAAGDALYQHDPQRRFVAHFARGFDSGFDRFLPDRDDARVVVAAVAVEQHAGVAGAEAQHAHQVAGDLFRQGDARADRERRIDECADHAHIDSLPFKGRARVGMGLLEMPAERTGERGGTPSPSQPSP